MSTASTSHPSNGTPFPVLIHDLDHLETLRLAGDLSQPQTIALRAAQVLDGTLVALCEDLPGDVQDAALALIFDLIQFCDG